MEPAAQTTDSGLFIVPASGTEAQGHIALSIARPIPREIVAALPSEFLDRVSDNGLYAWAATPGERNTVNYELMREGDHVLFYQDRHYSYICRVRGKIESAEAALSLWGADENGKVWSHMFFVSRPRRVDIPLERLSDFLQGTFYRGFTRLSSERAQRIRHEFGSIDAFVERELLGDTDSPNGYLLVRSNSDSKWNDSESIYRFGKTVPNYTKVKVGTALIVDSKDGDGIALRYSARVRDVEAEGDGQWAAHLTGIRTLGNRAFTLDELAELRAQPGYNVQHAIRPISATLYQSLTGTAPVSALPTVDPIAELSSRLFINQERAARLLRILERSRQIIFSGPPGTGKTHFASQLAQVWVGEDARWNIVQLHPSYAYEDFIEGIRPDLKSGNLRYIKHQGALLQMVQLAQADPSARYVLVIDELNRANSARVFGELLYSLEYRGREHTITLSSGADFYMPENLWLFCTINAADRSVSTLDSAFRRRFRHIPMAPDYEILGSYLSRTLSEDLVSELISRLRSLNDYLSELVGPDRLLGHTYLMRPNLSKADLPDIWEQDLAPVIADYLYNAPEEQMRLKERFLA